MGTHKSVMDFVRGLNNSASELMETLYTHYFTKKITTTDSPLIAYALLIPAIIGFSGFLLMGFIPFELSLMVAVAVFGAFTVLHFTLWVVGGLYAHGIVDSIRYVGFFIGVLVTVAISLIVFLYGGIIVGGITMTLLSTVMPHYLMPLMIVGFIVFSVGWYAKGLEYIDGV